MLDRRYAARQCSTQHQPRTRSRESITEQERFCPCMDLLLPFPEGILPHRYICQVNKDSLPSEACQEPEFRTDNPLLRPLSARLLEAGTLPRSPRAVYRWVEQGHSD